MITCSSTSTYLGSQKVITCELEAGHDGPHVDPDRPATTTGFWWDEMPAGDANGVAP